MVAESAHVKEVVGGKAATVLENAFGITTCGDLLRHYPRRYAERDVLTPLDELRPDDFVTVMARVAKVSDRPMRNRPGSLLTVVVTDGTGELSLAFFAKSKHQQWRARELAVDRQGLFSGKVTVYRGTRQLTFPDYQLVDDKSDADELMLAPLIPIYPATRDLTSWNLAKAIRSALDMVDVAEPLPDDLRRERDLIPLDRALRQKHRPEHLGQVKAADARLKYDEAFVMQVVLARRRAAAAQEPATPRTARPGGLLEAFDVRLPFSLTDGQQQVSREIFDDLAATTPMHRLLQGEVGSGKTVVALRAMLAVVDSGGQAALLAPTEVLAQQHARSIAALLGDLGLGGRLGAADVATSVALVTGSLSAAARRTALSDIAVGNAGIVVGTHALLEDTVQFFDLGLVVVDEQHRFGVQQRDALRSKAATPPHVLVMTATPIPRTVAMTVYGDLATSTLAELPAGRQRIDTQVVPLGEHPTWLERAWRRVREEVESGRQVYVVCPRIDADDTEDESWNDTAAVADLVPALREGPLAGLRVEALHGRLAPEVKDGVMQRFAAGEVDVLVATTVIEVGVDVANATAMVVLDADRFGISQLHQLRGRVGRGGHPGLCLLVTKAEPGLPARERLDGVAATLDGFALARLDVEQRREGDVLGRSQSGRRSQLRLLRLLRDEDVIATARADAATVVADDPGLSRWPALRVTADDLAGDERGDYLTKA